MKVVRGVVVGDVVVGGMVVGEVVVGEVDVVGELGLRNVGLKEWMETGVGGYVVSGVDG